MKHSFQHSHANQLRKRHFEVSLAHSCNCSYIYSTQLQFVGSHISPSTNETNCTHLRCVFTTLLRSLRYFFIFSILTRPKLYTFQTKCNISKLKTVLLGACIANEACREKKKLSSRSQKIAERGSHWNKVAPQSSKAMKSQHDVCMCALVGKHFVKITTSEVCVELPIRLFDIICDIPLHK